MAAIVKAIASPEGQARRYSCLTLGKGGKLGSSTADKDLRLR